MPQTETKLLWFYSDCGDPVFQNLNSVSQFSFFWREPSSFWFLSLGIKALDPVLPVVQIMVINICSTEQSHAILSTAFSFPCLRIAVQTVDSLRATDVCALSRQKILVSLPNPFLLLESTAKLFFVDLHGWLRLVHLIKLKQKSDAIFSLSQLRADVHSLNSLSLSLPPSLSLSGSSMRMQMHMPDSSMLLIVKKCIEENGTTASFLCQMTAYNRIPAIHLHWNMISHRDLGFLFEQQTYCRLFINGLSPS